MDINPSLKEDFQRWADMIGEEPYRCPYCVGILDVLKAHYLIVDYFQSAGLEGFGGIGPMDINRLHSAVSRQETGFGEFLRWENPLEVAATLFYGLIKDHPFIDGNKRTAVLILLYHLWKLGRIPHGINQRELENLALRVATNKLKEYSSYKRFSKKYREHEASVRFLAEFIRKNSRNMDKRQYIVTYEQLNHLLKRHGFYLDNPSGNFISVYKQPEEKKLFIIKRKSKPIRLGQIGFPGWKKEVSKKTLKRVRELTGLTPENGVDSKVFFQDVTPLPALIDQYFPLLKRLAKL